MYQRPGAQNNSKAATDRKAREEAEQRKREAEQRAIEAVETGIRAAVAGMEAQALAPNPDRCETAAKRVTELLRNPKAPKDFAAQMRALADNHLRSCYMKATSEAVTAALGAGHHEDKDLRAKKIGEARKLLARAVQLKTPPEFKLACERAIEAAGMTGFVVNHGPTKAKPADFAPKPPDRAHGDAPMKHEAPPVPPPSRR
jgi:hypothetical protein